MNVYNIAAVSIVAFMRGKELLNNKGGAHGYIAIHHQCGSRVIHSNIRMPSSEKAIIVTGI